MPKRKSQRRTGKRKSQRRTAVAVMDKWHDEKTPLFCLGGILFAPKALGPQIAMPNGVIEIINIKGEKHAILRSPYGSFVMLEGWSYRASVRVLQDWQGARIDVIFAGGGALLIADYDCFASLNASETLALIDGERAASHVESGSVTADKFMSSGRPE